MLKYFLFTIAFLSSLSFFIQKESIVPTEKEISNTNQQNKDESLKESSKNFIVAKNKSLKEKSLTLNLEKENNIQTNLEEIKNVLNSLSISIKKVKQEREGGLEQESINYERLNEKVRSATVNILCTGKYSGYFSPSSSSGVIIDPRGVILTNAHSAQYFLLKDYREKDFIDCDIRTGSPAQKAYKADLLYISPLWVRANSKNLKEEVSFGTGENDFALLLIKTSSNLNKDLPPSFPYIDLSTSILGVGDTVLIAGYPAEFLGGISIQKDLFLVSSISKIANIFSFKEKSADLFSIGDTISAQAGSSGSPVINTKGNLIGLITTSTIEKTTLGRNLKAISISHINKSLKKQENLNISDLLSYNLKETASNFNINIAPSLLEILTKDL